MASIYEARRANARRIGEKIKAYLETGHTVFDHEGRLVTSVHFTGFGKESNGLSFGYGDDKYGSIVYFDDDIECDNGMHDTVVEFNAKFSDWKVLNPADLKPSI